MRKLLVPFIATLTLVTVPAHADRGYYGRDGNRYHGGSGGYGHHGGSSVSPWAGLAIFGAIVVSS